MTSAAVEFLDVSKVIGQRHVLDGVNLQVHVGEFFALLGPSGCGKTTTLRLVAGFDQPTAGSITVNGRPMLGTPPYQRDVNLVFQNYALFPHLTVWQNVAFGLEMQRLPQAELATRTAEVLEMVQLSGFERRYPRQLSGGEQQRVALARAIVRRPSVLLLDEPLGALDLHLRKAVQWELKTLQRRLGITFIYVTHDQEEALTMADHLAVMDAGRVLQVGSPAEVYERPTTRFVASFIGETNFFSGRVLECQQEVLCAQSPHAVLQVCADPKARPNTGDVVTIAVRPEKISLSHTPLPGHYNCLTGVVEEAIYLGADTQYAVRLSDGFRLCARQQNFESAQRFSPGETVCACFPRQAAHVLRDSPTV
jgi:spermidine/putrescine transport system ATP-binding protein